MTKLYRPKGHLLKITDRYRWTFHRIMDIWHIRISSTWNISTQLNQHPCGNFRYCTYNLLGHYLLVFRHLLTNLKIFIRFLQQSQTDQTTILFTLSETITLLNYCRITFTESMNHKIFSPDVYYTYNICYCGVFGGFMILYNL